ncbi:uncharacterized protein LOC122860852 [Aphidius gifuensis]|uniref:uncharacterized protein LOC122860852 n=1 Tax=Aphidius gifuensis TaxID=684658 RepID=UPI001CDCA280|nr:uncharacterized protein LOC122860852 [Aphidius gifuensis]
MSAKRICIEKDQAISDDGDKDQKVVINSLDYDVLAQIIMLLPLPGRIDMEEVCTKWKEACRLAWYDVKKYKYGSSIGHCHDNRSLTQPYPKKILLRCGNYLKELSLSDVYDSSIMPFVGDHCKNLTSLECKFDNDSLINNADRFAQAFTQLDKLKCIKITVDFNNSNETINLSAIIDSLPEEINEIKLFGERGWNRKRKISMSFKKFKNLQKLTLHHICLDKINFQEIADITTLVNLSIGIFDIHTALSLFNKIVNLEYIDLSMDFEYSCVYNFSPKVLSIMPHLANTIVEYCKNLKHFRITSNKTIDTVLKKLTELKNLECLILYGNFRLLEEESIIAISNNCKKLKRLEIDNCTINDDESVACPSALDELSKLQYLEHLHLDTLNLEDSAIIAIANNCKNLKSLGVRGCTDLTETGLVALTNLENLEKLDVSYLDKITDSFLIKLKGLKELSCSYCQELTNAGIIQFINNNPDLEILDVRYINYMTFDN